MGRIIALSVFTLVLAGACIEPKAIVINDDQQEQIASDAGSVCVACIHTPDKPGPGCGDEEQLCFANDKCKATQQCAVDTGCYGIGSVTDLTSCLVKCADANGYASDPNATVLGANLYYCITDACKPVCIRDTDDGGTPSSN
jgi:hypothetical protein